MIIGTSANDQVVAKSLIMNDRVTGGRFGVVGATTPDLRSVSSPRNVTVTADLESTAQAVQAEIDRLTERGVQRVVLVSHLQSMENDKELIALLNDVDLAVAGGGDELLQNTNIDPSVQFLPGETMVPAGNYPTMQTNASGIDVPIVTTSGNYRYAGRLDVSFDADGNVVAVDHEDSYPRRVVTASDAATALGVTDAVTPDPAIFESAVQPVIECTESQNEPILNTEVVLDTGRGTHTFTAPGNRVSETNVGNTVGDAYLHAYDTYAEAAGLPARGDDNPVIAIQNGGGIRDNAGPVLPVGGVAPGVLSRKSTLDTLAFFTNLMTVVNDVTPEELKEIFERSGASLPAAGGQFLQVGGVKVTYTLSGTAQELSGDTIVTPGTRVQSIELPNGTKIVDNGNVVDGAPTVRLITNNFTAEGGDAFTTLADKPASGRINLGAPYEAAWVEYLLGLPTGSPVGLDVRPTITAAQYPVGGEGRIVVLP